jgi:hypothetical protein
MHGNQDAMDSFMRVIARVTSPAAFLSPDNASSILATVA